MNSAASPHHHHHHHHHTPLVFGPLPQTTYEASNQPIHNSALPITVDTASAHHQHQLTYNNNNNNNNRNHVANGGAVNLARRGPGTIRWNKEGVSTSAERRLPFVHRFRPVGLPPPASLGSAQPQQQQQLYTTVKKKPETAKKPVDKMAQYQTNPVGALQERYQSRGITPIYCLAQSGGVSHEPTFTYQVFINDLMATGHGKAKKAAKSAAARAMLDLLDGRNGPPPVETSGQTAPGTNNKTTAAPATTHLDQNQNSNKPGNPIGSLQEYCVKIGLPMPTYEARVAAGSPTHVANFETICRVGSLSTSNQATTKKESKRLAASSMLENLKTLGSEAHAAATNGNGDKPDEELLTEVAKMEVETLTPKHSKVLQEFYKKLQDSGKQKLYALHHVSLKDSNFDYVRLLGELGHEQKFEVTYVDIEERLDTGDIQCLVQLSTWPVAVCCGIGKDQSAANNDAARNALNYLKLMTKKSKAAAGQQQQQQQASNGK